MRNCKDWLLLSLVACALSTDCASAHAALRHATPPAGADLDAAPAELVLEFSEAINQANAQLRIVSPSGGTLVLALPEKPDPKPEALHRLIKSDSTGGTFHVWWRVMSIDGHWTRGDYTFTVTPK